MDVVREFTGAMQYKKVKIKKGARTRPLKYSILINGTEVSK